MRDPDMRQLMISSYNLYREIANTAGRGGPTLEARNSWPT